MKRGRPFKSGEPRSVAVTFRIPRSTSKMIRLLAMRRKVSQADIVIAAVANEGRFET